MTTNPKWFTTALDDRWSWDQSQRLGKPAALFCISKHPDRAEVFYDGNTARIVSQQYCQSDGHYKCKIVSSDGMGGCDPDAQEWEKEEVPETELMPNERQATPPTATPSISNSASAPSSRCPDGRRSVVDRSGRRRVGDLGRGRQAHRVQGVAAPRRCAGCHEARGSGRGEKTRAVMAVVTVGGFRCLYLSN